MKNKRLIILLSIFAFLIVVVVLCSTLFTVKNVSLNWLFSPTDISGLKEQETDIVNKDYLYGDSVFLLDKKQMINKLESEFYYLNVVKIETKFPNKLVLHIAERQELYALKIDNNNYAIVDGTCKVLKKCNSTEYASMGLKPIEVEITQFALSDEDFVLGQVADIARVTPVLKSFYSVLLENNYNELYSKGFISKLSINLGYNNSIKIYANYGIKIYITDIYDNLSKKFAFGIATYNNRHDAGCTNGTVNVYVNNGVISSEYVPE